MMVLMCNFFVHFVSYDPVVVFICYRGFVGLAFCKVKMPFCQPLLKGDAHALLLHAIKNSGFFVERL